VAADSASADGGSCKNRDSGCWKFASCTLPLRETNQDSAQPRSGVLRQRLCLVYPMMCATSSGQQRRIGAVTAMELRTKIEGQEKFGVVDVPWTTVWMAKLAVSCPQGVGGPRHGVKLPPPGRFCPLASRAPAKRNPFSPGSCANAVRWPIAWQQRFPEDSPSSVTMAGGMPSCPVTYPNLRGP
jgi:hypothetical protein